MTAATPPQRIATGPVSAIAAGRVPVSIVAGLATMAVAMSAIGPWPVGVFQDDGLYVILARALAEGEGYRFLNLPGAPKATHYPPGYPLFLAVLWKLYPSFPQNVTLFKFANAVLLGVATVLACYFARTRLALGAAASVFAASLFTACVPLVLLSVMVLSEPLFLVFLLTALILSERALREPEARNVALAIVAAVLLAHVRTLGVLVIPALCIALCWRRAWRAALMVLLGGVSGMLPWQLWTNAHAQEVPAIFSGKYGAYGSWLADAVRADGLAFLMQVARHNLNLLAAYAAEITATAGRAPGSMMAGVLAVLGLAGLWRMRTLAPATCLFIVLYVGVVLLWPFAPQRFLWGIWPLIGLTLYLGATTALRGRWTPIAVRGVGLAVLAGYVIANATGVQKRTITDVQRAVAERARPAAEWVAGNTPPDAVVATDDDALIYLYTGRRTVPNGRFTPQEHLVPQTPAFAVASLAGILDVYGVQYVLASSEYGVYASSGLMTTSPPRLRFVTGLSTGAVFMPVTAP